MGQIGNTISLDDFGDELRFLSVEIRGSIFRKIKEGRLRPVKGTHHKVVIDYNEMADFSLQQNWVKGNIREIIKID